MLLAFCLAEAARIPCMVVYDGFVLSHTYEVVELPDQERVDRFLPLPPGEPLIDPQEPQNIYAVTDFRYLARNIQERHLSMLKVPAAVQELELEYAKIFGRSYPLVEAVGLDEAEMYCCCSSAAQTVSAPPALNITGKKGCCASGFSGRCRRGDYFTLSSPRLKKLVVIDGDISSGTGGFLPRKCCSKGIFQECFYE